MPVGTMYDEGINSANLLTSLMKTLKATYAGTAELIAINNVRSLLTEWGTLPTYTRNADGSQGAQDNVPNPANPIVGVNMSRNDLNSLLTITAARFTGAALTGTQPEFLSLLNSKLPYQV